MKENRFLDGVSNIESDVVERFVSMDNQLQKKANKSKSKGILLRFGAIAACFVLIVSTVIVVPMLREDDPGVIVPPDGTSNDIGVNPGPGVEINLPSPPAYSSYDYESYNDIHKALTNSRSSQFIQLRLEQENCGELYQQTLSDFASGKIKVAVPQINGENINLRNQEGFSNITWFTSELYNLPWLWYHCLVNEQDLIVSIAYLNILDRAELNSATSYYEVLKMISPNSPSPDNYKQSASYKNIYEKEITLGNGKTATAMISELKNDSRIYVCLYLDGVLIKLQGDAALLTEDFLRMFSIAYME